jgi:DNA-binding transcriptional regulator LsrR (DeoR family)
MATSAYNKNLLYKLAKAYYEDDLTQQEIGKHFGLSRIKVSRLLRQARDEKVVQITITTPKESNAELERSLEARYGLDEAVVITPTSYTTEVIVQELGPAATDCLLRTLQGDEMVTISWGTSLLSVCEALPQQNWPEMKVIQMIGGLGRPEAEVYATDILVRTAQAFGAKPRMISAPGIVNSKLVRDALLSDPQITDTLDLAAKAEVAVVGIGRPTPGSVVLQSGILTPEELEQLHALGSVGDVALRFFDANGQAIDHEICERIIGLDLEQIKKIPRVIGVAGGEEKFEVIRAALWGKLVDVLVTDDRIARRLVDDVEQTLPANAEAVVAG